MRILVAAGLLVACAENGARDGRRSGLTLDEVTAHPEAYAGEQVRLRAGYYSWREVSVLTSGFAESDPPQPVEPLVWVVTAPPDACRVQADQGVVWAERVIATGTFRHDAEAGFGHLGAYAMALEHATLRCPPG
jgi:hypothetical protein